MKEVTQAVVTAANYLISRMSFGFFVGKLMSCDAIDVIALSLSPAGLSSNVVLAVVTQNQESGPDNISASARYPITWIHLIQDRHFQF